MPIKITRVNDERVVVSWHQFAEEHPGVLQWTLQYRTEDDNQIQNVTFDGSVHQYSFQGYDRFLLDTVSVNKCSLIADTQTTPHYILVSPHTVWTRSQHNDIQLQYYS